MLKAVLVSFMLIAVVAFGGVAWVALRPPPVAPVVADVAAQAPRAAYLAAARPLRAGTLIRAEDMAPVEMDVALAPAGARRDSREARIETVGSMVRRSLPAGEMIRAEDVLRPGERGFLASVLGMDMRAFSVSVDAVTGTAGLIWPGDRVDLLLTQQLNDETVATYRRVFGETVLADVRVIAIDQALVQGALGDAQPSDATRQTRTVTLEVTPRQAEMAAVATRLGRLSLIVRSAAEAMVDFDTGASEAGPGRQATVREAEQPVPVWGGDVSPGLRAGRTTSAPPQTLQIFLGGNRREEFRF